ncbi:DHA2 family methylenomycin A resistance protein-like MFS transporter [Nonomuraea thailandensis]|uniref:DHA2 family methylenomycin A resistance protein-like MFS transporter n=1 Tax=Nonomuraea thailandensis TaxID=1188745 RepID=A0A9X2K4X5_9ACTN|nr:MFS transporter [Nonomuraea thailandensis]MCP2359830.1 DHA2 family methylenomycin A resistance protein-like MFS transporter [Nonomuraea thailandensis]
MFGFSLGYFLVILDTTVLTIALPDLRASLGGSLAGQQWAVNAYTVAFAACLLTGGAVADRYGAARTFKLGVAAFGVLSLLSAAAPDLGVLIGLRALLGVAGALCTGGSLGLLAEMFPERAARARATGLWAAITGSALAAGPLLGGLLVDLYGWRAVFLLNPPIALISLLAVRGLASPRGGRAIDWWVQVLACAFLGLVAEALIDSVAVAALLSVAVLAVLVLAERRSHAPALPGGLLAATWPELLAGTVANFAFSGALFVLTLLLQDTRHLSPTATGLALLPLTLPMTVNPLLTGRLVARYGPRPPILGGLALIAAGLAGTALTGVLTPWLVVLGFGLSFVLPALMAGMVSSAPPGTAGAAGGVLNAFRQVGATLGVAVMGVIGRPLLAAAVLAALTCAGYALAARRARSAATA